MTNLSNLYVEKVNSEHPVAIWMLNDKVDYLSYLQEGQRNFTTTWNVNNSNVEITSESPGNIPINEDRVFKFSSATEFESDFDVTLQSGYIFQRNNLDEERESTAISFHLYLDTPFAKSISFGYNFTDSNTGAPQEISFTQDLSNFSTDQWHFLASTFPLPPEGPTDVALFIKVEMDNGGAIEDYDFFINGYSFASWSEEFHESSIGTDLPALPTDINLPSGLFGAEALPYTSNVSPGYYLGVLNSLFATNFGIPIVYGSETITKLTRNTLQDDLPSLIFPGFGFLNEAGRNNVYTAEMWLRINTDAADPRKIFGPISSNDGLYVEGGFLTLVVDNKYASHYVGEWFRPMLIHIRILETSASLLLNGEEVASIPINRNRIVLPKRTSEEGKDQDWVGFYAYEDVDPISVNSYAIYSYAVAPEVAKRRWVWGQAVVPPEQTNSSLNAVTAFNDYAFADYSSNYNYPDFANWKQSYFSNVNTTSDSLTLPDYSLPTFELGDKTIQQWYDSQSNSEDNLSLTFRPNSEWDNVNGHIFFDSLDILTENVKSFYAVLESDGNASSETLIRLENKNTKDTFVISLDGTTVSYDFTSQGQTTNLDTKTIVADERFTVGVNIDLINTTSANNIRRLFGNLDELQVFIAGDLSSTFTGKIYRVGFDAEYNSVKTKSLYDSSGILGINSLPILMGHTANYTLKAFYKYNIFFADIAVSGYWEDYIPLSYFGKYVTDYEGKRFYDLDFLQINLDYPEALEINSEETTSTWTYEDLKNEYENPVRLSYAILGNTFYTSYEDYQDLSEDSDKYYYYETTNAGVRSFLSFQYIKNGANKHLTQFSNQEFSRVRGTLDPDVQNNNWDNTAYEIVNGTIVYPPQNTPDGNPVNFDNLAVVVHLEFKSEGILHHPVNFRNLQIASNVLDRKDFTPIGTKFGNPILPYTKSGPYFDFKGKNPISLYKNSTPYLYLTRNSGWRVRGDFSPFVDRGLSLPVNDQQSDEFEISAVQLWFRFSERVFPVEEIPIFSITHKNDTFDFFVKGDFSLQRGSIVARSRTTNAIVTGIEYYLNGRAVKTPYIINEEWAVLGVGFPQPLDVSLVSGKIDLNGPMIYNNVSYYLSTNLAIRQNVLTRAWGRVKEDSNDNVLTWGDWDEETWASTKIVNVQEVVETSPSDIYKQSVISDRIVVDDNIEGVVLDPDEYRIYTDIDWSTTVQTPV